MMYLSQLILNPRDRAVRHDLANVREMHRTILRAFPNADGSDGDARAQFGILYRVDSDTRSDVIRLLVQSRVEPDWSALQDGYLLKVAGFPDNPASKPVGRFYETLAEGTELVFRLRANPTKRVSKRSTVERSVAEGKRVELRTEQEHLAWLARKGEGGGFNLLTVAASASVPDVRSHPGTKVTGRRSDAPPGRRTMTFGSVLFEGRLRVSDATRFRQTLETGIGSAKAYGFGLLSVAPIVRQ